MMVQYQETDWQYANRLAGRIGTVVIPDYLLDTPYLSIGMTKRPAKRGIDTLSYTMNKNVKQFRDRKRYGVFSERDDICYVVKSRDIFDLCDPISFLDLLPYVHTIETKYEGNELVHYYTLKESSAFYRNPRQNDQLIGGSLCGTVRAIQQDHVQVEIHGDTPQTNYQWFPYATPFSQPDGCGWYFMPEIGDEVRVQFPSASEYDAYVSSAVHVSVPVPDPEKSKAKEKNGNRSKVGRRAAGVALVAVAVAGAIVIVGDDATVVGVADDFLLGPLGVLLKQGAEMVVS